jgi:hypothetical protein
VSLVFHFRRCVLVLEALFANDMFETGHNRIMTYSDIAIAVARGFKGRRNIA